MSQNIYQDGKLKQISGNYGNVDAALNATSENPVSNKVLTEKIGTTDISSIGDGTVTGAISTLKDNLAGIPVIKFYTQSVSSFTTSTMLGGNYYATIAMPSSSTKVISAYFDWDTGANAVVGWTKQGFYYLIGCQSNATSTITIAYID